MSQETMQHVIKLLNTCEFAKYAPSAVTDNLQEVYQEAVDLISQIENQIKK